MHFRCSFRRDLTLLCFITFQVCVLFTITEARTCPRGSFDDGSACKKCGPGTFQNKIGSTSCKKCPVGTFTSASGVISRELCLDCPEDSNSRRGSSECFKCPRGQVRRCTKCIRCPPGSFLDGCDGCRKCFEDSFTTKANQDECERCPPGMRANQDRTGCQKGGCPPGFQFDSSECVECNSFFFGYRTFKNESMETCEMCPPRTTILDFFSPAVKCEKCPPGMFLTDIVVSTDEQIPVCEPCPPGSTTIGFGKPLCREAGKPCPDDMFEDAEGDCEICDSGFRYDPKNKRCVECGPDEVSKGGLRTKCKKCAAGQIPSFGTCVCPDSQLFRNGRCRRCPAGTFGTGDDCFRCGPSEFSKAGSTECKPCPEGSFSIESKGRTCKRLRCRKGFIQAPLFSSTFPENVCISEVTGCPKGLVGLGFKQFRFLCGDKDGNVVCPKGFFFNLKNECLSCSPGFRVVKTKGGKLNCRPCPRSMPVSRGGTTRKCRACKKGFRPELFNERCECPTGRFVDKDGNCVKCPRPSKGDLPKACPPW